MKLLLLSTLLLLWLVGPCPRGQNVLPGYERQPGQVPLPNPPIARPKNRLSGVYSNNVTLYYRNSPYLVEGDVTVETGIHMTIETGTQLYFESGVGLKIKGSIWAVGNEFAHIQMLPWQQALMYDDKMPEMRLIDGPAVRMGRLQMRFRDRWRSVCTKVTNWTSIDVGAACRTMGYGDGGFWRWFLRNNETYPLVMPKPDCHPGVKSILECPGFANDDAIPLSENLCQGEDDLGIICWGPPSFTGWARHWKGVQIFNSPFTYVNADDDMVSVQRESRSRLEFIDILYAGYDGYTKNVTSALWIEGVPPIMNGLRIERSARDGLYLYESSGPIIIANSTFSYNRGHGIAVDNTTDARFFVNMTRIEGNWGDGIWYRQSIRGIQMLPATVLNRQRRQNLVEEEKPRADICLSHSLPTSLFFPHLLEARLSNGTLIDPSLPLQCWMILSLPPRLEYTYSMQFLSVVNKNTGREREKSSTFFMICDTDESRSTCTVPQIRIPLIDGKLPQTIPVRSAGHPIFVGIEHVMPSGSGYLAGDVDVLFRVHASVKDKAFYGMNVTNSVISHNMGNGILGIDMRERTALHNVTVEENQGQAGFLVRDGASDIWLNDTRLIGNWGDGMNVSYAGGSINLNGTTLSKNRWRGFALHYNESSPFLAMHYEFVFKGRPSNNIFYVRSLVADNLWGGVLIGNFCIPAERKIEPKFLINWVEFLHNRYHPAIEMHACQNGGMARSIVDVSGNRIEGGSGMGLRISPAVNLLGAVSSNQFLNNNDTALLIKNAPWPQLWRLPANITISRNSFKFNRAKFIVSIGMNEGSPVQFLTFNQQNEIRENRVLAPYPHLKARSTMHAALVVSSSNVLIAKNCIANRNADYEIATELSEHAKTVNAVGNYWGTSDARRFMPKIFDRFYRYSLASISFDPYARVCNERQPQSVNVYDAIREFRRESDRFTLGGTVYQSEDLPMGTYNITDDIHIIPGATLTIAPGSTLQFADGVGMLVQGELQRQGLEGNDDKSILFTARPFNLPQVDNIRLVNDDDSSEVTAGRLEVFVDEQWGTVCNRSWTAFYAQMACNRLGLVMDPQFFENWRIFPPPGQLPMVMDNVRCEENEVDITRCRHDGPKHNIAAGCRSTEVVGIRCAEPRWAGVRFSLLANPPTVTGQHTMNKWRIEKAGVFDYRTSEFSAALQLDWNYHTFHDLEVRDNFWNGIDVVYNDLTKKPAIRNSIIENNRRNGIKIRSAGITIENVTIRQNGEAGLRYEPRITSWEQNDIVTWLDRKEQPDAEANSVYEIPNHSIDRLQVYESQLNSRKFLVAAANADCPIDPRVPCVYEVEMQADGWEYGLSPKMAVQIVNPAGNESDEDALLIERGTGRQWSVRKDHVRFPLLTTERSLTLRYTRSRGVPRMVLLFLFMDAQEYLDRFVHLYESRVENNAYGVSAVHFSNSSFADGTLTNRWDKEKLWFQKVNFTGNWESVIWIHSPQHQVLPGTPIAQITYHLDNCSLVENGGVIESHRDTFASANVFDWQIWSNTFANNTRSGFSILLPDTYDLLSNRTHSFKMTENRFENNTGLRVVLDGYYAWANISSNNFTDNWAPEGFGILEVAGMEKFLIMERNRFLTNWGHWMFRMHTTSHSLRSLATQIPASIQYNYFQFNHFTKSIQDSVDMWPRSYTLGVFGSQKADVHFNRVKNDLMDFEMVAGGIPLRIEDSMNVTYNWWGSATDATIAQRIFDVDDWNTYTAALYSPFYTSEEQFINFWWHPNIGQQATASPPIIDVYDLKGRLYESKNLAFEREKWQDFPFNYRPFRPYRIVRDLTVMPGVTLNIENGVEVHVWPGVRILVLGDIKANGTYWDPVRFKPINTTEYDQLRGKVGTRYKRSTRSSGDPEINDHDLETARWLEGGGPFRRITWKEIDSPKKVFPRTRIRNRRSDVDQRVMQYIRQKRAAFDRSRLDKVFREFPVFIRDDPYYQRFNVRLNSQNSTQGPRAGFVEVHNATSGEVIPLCDRQFTLRNAYVICRELGMETPNAQHWVTPRWSYDPRLRLVKTYVEPRECRGDEKRLDLCPLRLTGNDSQWMCMDNEHFNYVHCGSNSSLNSDYIGNWGGITFAHNEYDFAKMPTRDSSFLEHVEIVGGGLAHNDSLQSAGLQLIYRSPPLAQVNVTNSSLHAIQVISPRQSLELNRINVTDNKGHGVHILTLNLQQAGPANEAPLGPLSIPYLVPGMVNICAAEKRISVLGKLLVYYKYDSRPVDCVKQFIATGGRRLAFRFIKVNLYSSFVDLGRPDALRVYSSATFSPAFLLADFRAPPTAQALYGTPEAQFTPSTLSSTFTSSLGDTVSADQLALHLRASAADGIYGFIGEIAALPDSPDQVTVAEVKIKQSRIDRNDQGALSYENTGEMSPVVIVDDCSFHGNCFHLYGNVSTCMQAVQMSLHNTQTLLFRGNSLVENRGGLLVAAKSASAGVALTAIVKGNLFVLNSNSTTMAFFGNDYQTCILTDNIITQNYALYFDTVLVDNVALTADKNIFSNNTGLHTIETKGHSRVAQVGHTFRHNVFVDNIALGHGFQYKERYGYLPEHPREDVINEFNVRPRRQVISQSGVSFDWWTHVDDETERYRSTILAGSSRQTFTGNVFSNPANSFELTTAKQTQYDVSSIDARGNYWGYPGTTSVAAGRIRDRSDYSYLIDVDFKPVLESNASLVEGECPGGWWRIGDEEFQACYLFIGASATYHQALKYCTYLGGSVPYLTTDDRRKKLLAARVFGHLRNTTSDAEKNTQYYTATEDTPFWVASEETVSTQCGGLSSREGTLRNHHCDRFLPFVCELGTQPSEEPPFWRGGVILAVVLSGILFIALLLLCLCWCWKTRRRDEGRMERRNIMRASLQLQKKNRQYEAQKRFESAWDGSGHESARGSLASTAADAPLAPGGGTGYKKTTRPLNMRSPTETVHTSCSDSLSTDQIYDSGRGSEMYSSADYYKTPRKNNVSSSPNPYAEIPTLATFHPSKPGGVRLRDVQHGERSSYSRSSATPTSCSTCPVSESERSSTRDSTESSSARSSTLSSEATIMQPQSGQRARTTSAGTIVQQSPLRPSAPTPRTAAPPPHPLPSPSSLPRRPAPPPPLRSSALRSSHSNLSAAAVSSLAASALARSNPSLYERPQDPRGFRPVPQPHNTSLVNLVHPREGGPRSGDVFRHTDDEASTLVETSM